jgi:hypothetical protein
MCLKYVFSFLWYNIKKGMVKKRYLYDEVKATQVAALLLAQSGGEMNYATCIKLLYGIEREAINRWLRPVLYDDLYSLPYGQVVSNTLDLAEPKSRPVQTFWGEYIKTRDDNTIQLIKECGIEKLSRAEISLIKEIYEANKNKTPGQLFDEHHDPKLFPEYKNPGRSSIKTSYVDLLRALGKTEEQIKEFEDNLDALANLEALT